MIRYKAQKYFLYLRRSQDAEDRQMASLEDQESEMLAIAEKMGLSIVDTVRESQSAKKPGRPKFNEMITRIHAGEADGILCWKINRLARNPVDGGQISWLLQQGVIKHIQTFSRDYQPSDNVIMMAVELGMANQFVNDLSTDVKRGMRQKAERGWLPQQSLPIGYAHNKGYEKGEPEIVTTKQLTIVKKLFKDMLSGSYSASDIQRRCHAYGLTGRHGRPICLQTVFNMLTNEFYCGYFYWKDGDGFQKRYHGKHTAILTEEEFNQVQRFLGKKGKPTRVNKLDFAYRGPLTCGECGCSITAEEKVRCVCSGCKYKFSCRTRTDCPKCGLDISEMANQKIYSNVYYRCTKKHKQLKCSQSVIDEKDLKKQVNQEFSKVELTEDFYHWAMAAIKHNHGAEIETQNEVAERLENRSRALRDRLDELVLMKIDKELSVDQYTRLREGIEKDLVDVDQEQRRLKARMSDWADTANRYLTFADRVVAKFNKATNEEKREMLANLGSTLEILDKKLCITTANELLGFKNVHNKLGARLGKFDTKKALDIQELFGEKRQAFLDLCAGLDSNQRRT